MPPIIKYLVDSDNGQLDQQERENLNRLILINEIESVTKNSPNKKSPRLDVFTADFYQTHKKN